MPCAAWRLDFFEAATKAWAREMLIDVHADQEWSSVANAIRDERIESKQNYKDYREGNADSETNVARQTKCVSLTAKGLPRDRPPKPPRMSISLVVSSYLFQYSTLPLAVSRCIKGQTEPVEYLASEPFDPIAFVVSIVYLCPSELVS